MEPMTIREIMDAVGGKLLGEFGDINRMVGRVETDSRTIHAGSLFVPLVGERFDGHAYINAALEGGAAGCFTQRERESYLPGKFYIKVDSTQRALRDLAKYYKKKFPIPVVALTGSVGKTTTKDVVLMTNIGDSHIEHFGSREKILEAKSEIFHHVKSGAFVVINGDDPLLNTLPGKLPYAFTRVGAGEGLDYRAERLVSDGKSHMTCEVKTPHNSFPVEIPALGDHMIYPTLMAAAVGEHFGLTQTQIADGVLHFAPTKMRMNLLHRGDDITILNDTYNANPQSMRAAVEVLSSARGAYKVAVLGDMFELGPLAPALHAGVGDYLGKAGIDCLVAVGELARHIHDAAQAAGVPECYYCPTKAEARPVLDGVVRPHATILVKASRGMALEELVDYLLTITGEA